MPVVDALLRVAWKSASSMHSRCQMTGSISVLDKPAATHGLIGLCCQPDGVKTFPARASASRWDGGSRAEGRSRERKTPAVHGRRVSLPFVPFSAAKRRGHDPRLPISQQLLNNGLSGVKAGVLWIYKFPFSARETTSWLVYPPKPCHMCRNFERCMSSKWILCSIHRIVLCQK
jgi:hypothetical protein